MFGGYNFAPAGWMFCEGQLLPISENEVLFQLIGTTYGGDGQENFALPDLRGRLPLHMGGGFTLAETGGVETVTLTVSQMPTHSHPLLGSAVNGNQATPANNLLANSTLITPYAPETPNRPLAATSVGSVGLNIPHSNFQPYLCVNFIISLYGLFPSQT
jgi:microcystin-dependent protein